MASVSTWLPGTTAPPHFFVSSTKTTTSRRQTPHPFVHHRFTSLHILRALSASPHCKVPLPGRRRPVVHRLPDRVRRVSHARMGDSTTEAPATPVLRVVAISGSLRRASANTGLIRAAAEICKESIPGMQVDHVDISELPLLNTDLEVDGGFPPAVEAFRAKVRAADCFLFASPEYNYSISGPLKNALDWGSRPPNCWADRAAAILSASGGSGGSRSQYHIRQVGVFLDIHFINKPEIFTKAHQPPRKFDDDGNLIDPETKEQLRKMLLSLQAFALRLQGKPANSGQGN